MSEEKEWEPEHVARALYPIDEARKAHNECYDIFIEDARKAIKSLESRLKEAEKENAILKELTSEEIVLRDVVVSEIQERLSQAEAENNDLKRKWTESLMGMGGLEESCSKYQDRIKELEKLIEWHKTDTHDAMEWKRSFEARLSHLMDVAGKMAGAMERLLTSPDEETHEDDCRKAKQALAEYRSIK